jgi:hypothetical protein
MLIIYLIVYNFYFSLASTNAKLILQEAESKRSKLKNNAWSSRSSAQLKSRRLGVILLTKREEYFLYKSAFLSSSTRDKMLRPQLMLEYVEKDQTQVSTEQNEFKKRSMQI